MVVAGNQQTQREAMHADSIQEGPGRDLNHKVWAAQLLWRTPFVGAEKFLFHVPFMTFQVKMCS